MSLSLEFSSRRLLLLPLWLSLVALAGCLDATPVSQGCDTSNCTGCCSSGTCVGGQANGACGQGGNLCDVCGAGQSCTAGRCVTPALPDAGAACAPKTDAQLCAAAGQTCGALESETCGEARHIASCGTCKNGDGCSTRGACECVGQTDGQLCAANAAACGPLRVTDRCNVIRNVLSCGSCVSPQTCDPINRCVCVPESNAQLCAAAAHSCGPLTVVDKCGAARVIASCGICASPTACDPSGQCVCTPETDAQLCARGGRGCGALTLADNCNKARTVASCGSCVNGNTCSSTGVCSCPAETIAAFCQRVAISCGPASGTDLCGNPKSVSSCGSCFGSTTCGGGGKVGACGCAPQSDADFCAVRSKDCGTITGPDNCGVTRTATCGSCASPLTCGGSGTTNLCGCTPESDSQLCTRLAKNCGAVTATDGCGASRTVVCGPTFCTTPQSCGGGGVTNVCGCTAETDAQLCTKLAKNCGQVSTTDRCNVSRAVDCGATCPANTTCGGGGTLNVCGCTTESDAAFCGRLGKACGSVTAPDRCGVTRTVASCGACAPSSVCGSVTPNTCTAFKQTFSPICNPEGWCWENPLPLGNSLFDVLAVSASDIWVVGSEQLLLHYDGTGWSGSFDGKKPALRAIWALDSSDLWAVGDSASVLHRSSGSWAPVTITSGTTNNLTSVFGFASNDLWIGGSYVAWKFNGTTWTPYSMPGAVTGLWGAASNDLWAVGKTTYNTGFISHWNGTAWTTQTGSAWAFDDLLGFSASDLYAVASGHIVHWNGAYWADVSNLSCTGVWGTSGTNLWFSCGTLKRYDGSTFTDVAMPDTTARIAGDATGPLISISAGALDRQTGGQWARLSPTQVATTDNITSLQIFSGGDAVGHLSYGLGNLVRRAGVWGTETEAVILYNQCTWGTSADDYWIGSQDSDTHRRPFAYHKVGASLVSTNLTDFTNVRYPNLTAMWGSGPSDLWGVGERYYSYSSGSSYYDYGFFHFDGTLWTAAGTSAYTDTGTDSVVSYLDGASATEVWAADTGHTIWKLLGGSWQRFNTGSPLTASDTIGGLWVQSTARTWFTGSFGVLTFDSTTGYGARQPVPAFAPSSYSVVRAVRQTGTAAPVAIGESGTLGVAWVWNGTAWVVQSVFPSKLKALALDGTQLVAVGESGRIFRKP